MDWAHGYVTDIGYTNGYIPELNPSRVALPLAQAGLASPTIETACELGFGQGFSLAVHASASHVGWWGADVNPSHTANARGLIAAGGGQAQASDEAFADFCQRSDLPDFDFIGLHGVWSWVDADNKAVIADFMRRKLKVGGVVYISYNTLPGWNAMAPVRHLMTQHQAALSGPGAGRAARVDAALKFAETLLQLDPLYLRAAPTTVERFAAMQKMDRRYLAHEFFNASWTPYYFAEMAEALAPAKLTFAGSCHLVDHVDAMNHTPEQIAFLQAIPDPVLRQSVRDVMVNQQFRRDYWIKGPVRLDPAQRDGIMLDMAFVLARPADQAPLKAPGGRGEVSLKQDLFRAIPEAMGDHAPVTAREILERVRAKGLTWRAVQDALLIMASTGTITMVQPKAQQRDVSAFNAHVMGLARGQSGYGFLASPVTGGAVSVPRLSQLMLAAHAQGITSPAAQAQTVQAHLASRGERLAAADGAPQSPEAERVQLLGIAEGLAREMPILQGLGVVPGAAQAAETHVTAAA
jgi:SAM-dependent methyltransferase